MKVTMLRNPSAKYGCSLIEGETGDVNNDLAKQLIDDRIAIAVGDGATLKGVSPEPKIKASTPTQGKV